MFTRRRIARSWRGGVPLRARAQRPKAVERPAPRRGGIGGVFRDPLDGDPGSPLGVHFDPASAAFWVEPLPYGPPGRIRAFRVFTSPLL
jgi:hypothetical protein